MLGFQGGVSIPLVKGGVKAPPAKRQCRAGPKAGARRGFTYIIFSAVYEHLLPAERQTLIPLLALHKKCSLTILFVYKTGLFDLEKLLK